MSADAGWLRSTSDGSVLDVWAVPGAARPGVAGLHGGALRVRVAAPAEAGAANREILRVLAAALGVRPGHLTLESGTTGRRKRVRIRGLAAAEARRRLAAHVSVDTPGGDN